MHTDDELAKALEKLFENRARLDVLERAVAIFMANSNRQIAMAIEADRVDEIGRRGHILIAGTGCRG